MHKLAVLVTCFNQEDIILKTITSLINQTLDNNLYHIYISDHNSTDNSLLLLRDFCKTYPNITIKVNKTGGFVGNNRNHLVKMGEGDYAVFVDGDDPQAPEFLEQIYTQLNNKDFYYLNQFEECWDNKTVSKNALLYDNLMFKVYNLAKLKQMPIDDSVEIGEDVLFASKYYNQLHDNFTIINATYRLNRNDDNVSLTKNKDMMHRYSQEVILYEKLISLARNKELQIKLNNKKVELIQLEVLLGITPHAYDIDEKLLSKKFYISYKVYKICKKLMLLNIYKILLNYKIGYKY